MSVESAEPKRPVCVVCQDFDRFGQPAVARLEGGCRHRTRTMYLCSDHTYAALTNRVLCMDDYPDVEEVDFGVVWWSLAKAEAHA